MNKVLIIKNTEFAYGISKKPSALKVRGFDAYGNKKHEHKTFTHSLHYTIQYTYPDMNAPFIVPIKISKTTTIYYLYIADEKGNPSTMGDRIFDTLIDIQQYWHAVFDNKNYVIKSERNLQFGINTLLIPTKITGYLDIKSYSRKALLVTITGLMFTVMNLYGLHFYTSNYSQYKTSYENFLSDIAKDSIFSWSEKTDQKEMLLQCAKRFYKQYYKSPSFGWEVHSANCTKKTITVQWRYTGKKKEKRSLSFVNTNTIAGKGKVKDETIIENYRISKVKTNAGLENTTAKMDNIIANLQKGNIIKKKIKSKKVKKKFSTLQIMGKRITLTILGSVITTNNYLTDNIKQFIVKEYNITVLHDKISWEIIGDLYER